MTTETTTRHPHQGTISYYDSLDAELAALRTEHRDLSAKILPAGTAERARRDEVWARICEIERGARARAEYRAGH